MRRKTRPEPQEFLLRALEYHVPKLARTELTRDVPEQPQTIRIVFVPPPERTEESDDPRRGG